MRASVPFSWKLQSTNAATYEPAELPTVFVNRATCVAQFTGGAVHNTDCVGGRSHPRVPEPAETVQTAHIWTVFTPPCDSTIFARRSGL